MFLLLKLLFCYILLQQQNKSVHSPSQVWIRSFVQVLKETSVIVKCQDLIKHAAKEETGISEYVRTKVEFKIPRFLDPYAISLISGCCFYSPLTSRISNKFFQL